MAEAKIIEKESSFKTTAKNKYSSAFGLGQMIEGQRIKYAGKLGYSPSTTDPIEQRNMFRAYVADRYGTAEKAWDFWQSNGWY